MLTASDYMKKRGLRKEDLKEADAMTDAYINGYRLSQSRKKLGLSVSDVARNMGVSTEHVNRMEDGDVAVMTLDDIQSYVKALNGHIKVNVELPNCEFVLA